jgi:hypothetical protein
MKNVVYLKGEFEAEGLEQTEVSALIATSKEHGLQLAIKIGGCEARSDYMYCRRIMADSVIAPMIESPFAAEKLVELQLIWSPKRLCINIETDTGVKNIESILDVIEGRGIGIVFGRSDYSASIGLKGEVNHPMVFDAVYLVAKACFSRGISLTVGGGMHYEGFLKLQSDSVISQALDFVETRKVVFDARADLSKDDFVQAIELECQILSSRVGQLTEEVGTLNSRIASLKRR